MSRRRPHPGFTLPIEPSSLAPALEPPPFTNEELKNYEQIAPPSMEQNRLGEAVFFKRLVFGLLATAFGLLGFFLALETIQAVGTILSWPGWAAIPLLTLIGLAILYAAYRIARLTLAIHRLKTVNLQPLRVLSNLSASERDALRKSLVPQLQFIVNTPNGRSEQLLCVAQAMLGEMSSRPSDAWFRQYLDNLHPKLKKAAMEGVNQIAVIAGTSAALSPWKLVDSFVAMNSCVECASHVLRTYGIRPDSVTSASCALDALVATFLAATLDDLTEDAAVQMSEGISSALGQKAVQVVAPKLAQGIAVAFFVRRIGRRIVKMLAIS